MKRLGDIARFMRTLVKYGGIIIVIFDIVQYAADKLEGYSKSKSDNDKPTD